MGPDSYLTLHDRLSNTSQPHNVLVQLILDFGWLGTGIILLCAWRLLSSIMYKPSRLSASCKLPYLLSTFIIAYIVFSLFDGLFYYPLPMLHFIAVVAILYSITKQANAASEPNRHG